MTITEPAAPFTTPARPLKDTRLTVSITREDVAALKDMARELDVPAAQLVRRGVRLVLAERQRDGAAA